MADQRQQLDDNVQKFKETASELHDAMEQKRRNEENYQKFCAELSVYEDEFEKLDTAGKSRLMKCLADIMQQTQDNPDIGDTDEFWESTKEKLLAEVLPKEDQSDEDDSDSDSDDEDVFDKLNRLPKEEQESILRGAAKQMYDDAKPYRLNMAKTYLTKDEIKKLEADSDEGSKRSAESDIPLDDEKEMDPETKSKMEQIEALKKLYNAADPKFCDMDQMFKQTMNAVVDIVTPDEAQTMTFEQKQEQRCKEFMRQVNIELYSSKFKKVRISDEIKSNIEYAKKDLEARGFPVSDVETLATSNAVDGQKQLFKHSINVTLVE
jgi:hypothetical protein